ncbi:caspase family protein [Actinomadura sp. NTSP31]|uniref:caspase, EACC1-associated type n=1 Tax=Actinomadura sp. NTSP31 TaxID=1735447 RepID=UPI0035C0B0AC
MNAVPDPSASRAVLVGTGRYAHPSLDDLPAVAANLAGLAELLRSPDVWGLPARNCTVVADPASAAEMITPIVQAAAEATDTLLVYYAGHGLVARLAAELHLALTGSEKDKASYTAVPYGLIREELAAARADRQIVVLDCCYSGRALGRMAGGDSAAIVADEAVIDGTYLIAAAAETRTALSVPGEPHTAFTAELLHVLRRGVPGKGPYLDLDTLYREIAASLRAKQRPLPQRRVRNTADRLTFRNRAFKGGAQQQAEDGNAGDTTAPADLRRHGRELLTEAERIAHTVNAKNQASAFEWVCDGLAEYDPAAAERLARTKIPPKKQGWALWSIVRTWAGTDLAEAERVARTITDPEILASALNIVVGEMARRAPGEAERLARTITDPRARLLALRSVGEAVSDPGQVLRILAEAEDLARSLADPAARIHELQEIAVLLLELDPRRARDLLAEVQRLARSTTDPYKRWMELRKGIVAIAQRSSDEAERLIHSIVEAADPTARRSVVTSIVREMAEDVPAVAERIAYTIADPHLHAWEIREIIEALARRDPAAALRLARAVTGREEWVSASCIVAEVVADHDPGHAAALLTEAEGLARAHASPHAQAQDLASIAVRTAGLNPSHAVDLLTEAERLARTEMRPAAGKSRDLFGRDPATIAALVKANALRSTAQAWAVVDPPHAVDVLAEAERLSSGGAYDLMDVVKVLAQRDPDAALRATRLAADPDQQSRAVTAVIDVLAVQDPAEAEQLSLTLTGRRKQSTALQTVARALIERDPAEAERVTRIIPHPAYRIEVLTHIARALAHRSATTAQNPRTHEIG